MNENSIRHPGKVKIVLGLKTTQFQFGGWARSLTIDGAEYRVGVTRGKAVRIAYKPRGENIGHQWNGWVMKWGSNIWAGRVGGSLGARGLLKRADVIE